MGIPSAIGKIKNSERLMTLADIYGRNTVKEALLSHRPLNKIWIAKDHRHQRLQEIIQLAKKEKVEVVGVDAAFFDKRFPKANHQGVVASLAESQYVSWQEILAKAKAQQVDPFVVVLDEITDPHNLGAIIRSAEAFGAHGVIIPERRSASLTEGAAKAAAGALNYMPVARVGNINDVLLKLKAEGLWVAGADMGGEVLYKAPLKGPLAVVIGNEGKGIRPLVRKNCDFMVAIPMCGQMSSLNASVAAGIVLAEVAKSRRSL